MVSGQEAPASADRWALGWPQTTAEFEALIDAFQNRLVRYAFRRLGEINEAEDAIQEVFVKAYVQRQKRRNVAYVGPYLFRMAANACADVLRKRKKAAISLDQAGVENIPDRRPDSSRLVAAAERAQQIEERLGRLPKRQAETIRLRFYDEMSFVEIAKTLGCSASTVKSRLRYGLSKLRKMLRREEEALR